MLHVDIPTRAGLENLIADRGPARVTLGALFARRSNEGRTTTDVAPAARFATWGAIQTLIVDIDGIVPGTVDDEGRVSVAEGQGPASYGIVDEIAVRALLSGARVIAARRDEVPGGGDLAAILRYAG